MSRAKHKEQSISLFPFLDVLVCVMGSLIFMLILISAKIRSDVVAKAIENLKTPAETAPEFPDVEPPSSEPEEPAPIAAHEPPDPPIDVELAPEIIPPPPVAQPDPPDPNDELRRQIAALAARKAADEEALARWRNTVAAAKKKYDETRDQIAKLDAKHDAISSRDEGRQAERKKLDEEKKRLFAELVLLETQVRQAQKPKNDASSKFTFVPYDGSSGTTRRPILIECTVDGIRFVPEDVAVTATDVAGFHERYNPLLAGANALVKYWRAVDGTKPGGESAPSPYVLLIVRPNGTVAYYYARKMLSQMTEPFGYELLEDGRELDLPPVDPQARAVVRQAISETIAERNKILADIEGDVPDERPSFDSPRRLSSGVGGGASGGGGPGSGGDGKGGPGERKLRYRPGMGFEVVEGEEGPVPDDPFERAVQARRAKNGLAGGDPSVTPGVGAARNGSSRGAPNGVSMGPSGPGTGPLVAPGRGGAESPGGGLVAGDGRTGTGSGSGSGKDDGVSPLTIRPRGTIPGGAARPGGPGNGSGGTIGGGSGNSDVAASGEPGGVEGDPAGTTTGEGTDPSNPSDSAEGGPVILPGNPRGTGAATQGGRSAEEAAHEPPELPIGGNGSAAQGNRGGRGSSGATGSRNPSMTGSRGAASEGAANSGELPDETPPGGRRSGSGSGGTSGGGSPNGGSSSGGGSPGGAAGKPGATPGGTGAAFDAPLVRNRNGNTQEGQHRYGYYSKRAAIGFERTLTVRVEGDNFKFPSGRTVPIEYGDRASDVTDNLIDAVDQEARTWGKPPDSFYWVPSLHFIAAPGDAGVVEQIREPLQKAGLTSRVERKGEGSSQGSGIKAQGPAKKPSGPVIP